MLEAVERELNYLIVSLGSNEVTKMYKNLPPGKRLRAKLILSIAGKTPSSIKLSAIVELIHTASLLHDDVIDDAKMRRSLPSLNAIFGNKAAIMLGDILYSKGYAELAKTDKRIAEVIAQSVTKLSMGELSDVLLSKGFNPDKDAYLAMIYKKTGALIEASAHSAAILANKKPDNYKKFGKNIGIAFQMIDDILDVTSDSKTLGKPALHDYAEGKTTLPYLYLYESATPSEKQTLQSYHAKKLTPRQIGWIKERMEFYGVLHRCRQEAKGLVYEAIELMRLENEPKLESIAYAMIEREF